MILPQSPLLRSEDYDSTVQSWIGRLLSPLNTFITAVTTAVNGRLTFKDNILGQQKTLSFIYSANTLPISFAQTISSQPTGLMVVGATENSTPVAIHAAWQVSGGSIQITDLVKLSKGAASALTTGATYNLTVRADA